MGFIENVNKVARYIPDMLALTQNIDRVNNGENVVIYNFNYKDIDTDIDAEVGDCLQCQTLDNSITITLPLIAGFGDVVVVKDISGNARNNNIRINANGNNIESRNEDLIIDYNFADLKFIYRNTLLGWNVIER